MTYDTGYLKERIGGRNPYSCCAYCKVPDPQINGELENHADWCEYKQQKLLKEKVELLELEVEVLKLELQSPVYCVILEPVDDNSPLQLSKLYRSQYSALNYQTEKEKSSKGKYKVHIEERLIT